MECKTRKSRQPPQLLPIHHRHSGPGACPQLSSCSARAAGPGQRLHRHQPGRHLHPHRRRRLQAPRRRPADRRIQADLRRHPLRRPRHRRHLRHRLQEPDAARLARLARRDAARRTTPTRPPALPSSPSAPSESPTASWSPTAILFDAKNLQYPQVLAKQYNEDPTDDSARQIAHHFADEIILRLGGGITRHRRNQNLLRQNPRQGHQRNLDDGLRRRQPARRHPSWHHLHLAARLARQLPPRLCLARQVRLPAQDVLTAARPLRQLPQRLQQRRIARLGAQRQRDSPTPPRPAAPSTSGSPTPTATSPAASPTSAAATSRPPTTPRPAAQIAFISGPHRPAPALHHEHRRLRRAADDRRRLRLLALLVAQRTVHRLRLGPQVRPRRARRAGHLHHGGRHQEAGRSSPTTAAAATSPPGRPTAATSPTPTPPTAAPTT